MQAKYISMGNPVGGIVARDADILSINFCNEHDSKRSDPAILCLEVDKYPDGVGEWKIPIFLWHASSETGKRNKAKSAKPLNSGMP